jgi:CheY-like chemotaxis protein
MDINLPDMLGSEATKIMRSYEKEYSNKKSIIIAVSVEGKNNVGENDLFNDYCKLNFI